MSNTQKELLMYSFEAYWDVFFRQVAHEQSFRYLILSVLILTSRSTSLLKLFCLMCYSLNSQNLQKAGDTCGRRAAHLPAVWNTWAALLGKQPCRNNHTGIELCQPTKVQPKASCTHSSPAVGLKTLCLPSLTSTRVSEAYWLTAALQLSRDAIAENWIEKAKQEWGWNFHSSWHSSPKYKTTNCLTVKITAEPNSESRA